MTSRTPIMHQLDGTEFQLAERTDLSFLQRYGRVFRVFDDHDSGNISFGVDDGNQLRFIKLAGAATVEAGVSPEFALEALRNAEGIYQELAHPNIVRLQESFEQGPYFGLVFDWNDGVLLRRIYTEQFERFRALSVEERLATFDTVIEVMQHIHDCGYVAIDIYDASFLYDFENQHLTICDIDVFEKAPLINTMGRMWGSTRFMSPEEFELGAAIDEITNIYTLGAVAFLMLGDERERTMETWDADEPRYKIATRATSDDRADRFASIAEFAAHWCG